MLPGAMEPVDAGVSWRPRFMEAHWELSVMDATWSKQEPRLPEGLNLWKPTGTLVSVGVIWSHESCLLLPSILSLFASYI